MPASTPSLVQIRVATTALHIWPGVLTWQAMYVAGDSELMWSTPGIVFVKVPGTGTVLGHAEQVSDGSEGPHTFTWQDGACVIAIPLQQPCDRNSTAATRPYHTVLQVPH